MKKGILIILLTTLVAGCHHNAQEITIPDIEQKIKEYPQYSFNNSDENFFTKCEINQAEACYIYAEQTLEAGLRHTDMSFMKGAIDSAKKSCSLGNIHGCDLVYELIEYSDPIRVYLDDKYRNNIDAVSLSKKDLSKIEFLETLQKGCERNNPFACALAKMFLNNKSEALDYLKKCSPEDDKCTFLLSYYYSEGMFVEKDKSKALSLSKNACSKGGKYSCSLYADLTSAMDKQKSKSIMKILCKAGLGSACDSWSGSADNLEEELDALYTGCVTGSWTVCDNLIKPMFTKFNKTQLVLGKKLDRETEDVIEDIFKKACYSGNGEMCNELVEYFQSKGSGWEREAEKYAIIGASQWHGEVLALKLARLYSQGTQIKKNIFRGLYYYTQACPLKDEACFEGATIAKNQIKYQKTEFDKEKYRNIAKKLLGELCDRKNEKACKKYSELL